MKKLFVLILLVLPALTLLAQNPDFQRRYQQAQHLYDEGQYEKARTAIQNSLKNLPSLSQDQIQAGQALETRCTQAIARRDQLDVASELPLSYLGLSDSIAFKAARPSAVKAVSSAPAWFKVDKITDQYIHYSTELNREKQPRSTQLVVTMGNVRRTVRVEQAARPETEKRLVIHTEPDHATVTVAGRPPVTGIWEDNLATGVYQVRAEKNGYFPVDTTFTVVDDMQIGQLQEIVLALKPQFARFKIDILPQEGFSFGQEPVSLTLNGVAVSAPHDEYNYDDDRDLQRYTYYADGTIPVSAGLVDVVVSAKSFEPVKAQVQARAGEMLPLSYTLKAISGYLTLVDEGQSLDAVVRMDGEKMGVVRDMAHKPVLTGEHVITLEKDGYMSRESSYPVNIREQEEVSVNVSMVRFRPFLFTSDPSDAKVSVDGEVVGYTPTKPYFLRDLGPDHVYKMVVEKDHYFPIQRDIVVDFNVRDTVSEHARLQPSHAFSFAGDEPGLLLTVKDRRTGDSLFVNQATLPLETALPWRDKPYYYEVARIGQQQPAYRGTFKFNEGSQDKLFIRSWSTMDFSLLSGNLYLVGPSPVNIGLNNKPFRNTVNLNLVKFRIFKGLSTSVIRGTLFKGTESQTPLEIPVKSGMETTTASLTNANLLPGLSFMFINGEFRVGGGVHSLVDVDAIVSYAWYPDFWKKILSFPFMSGHDLFVGAEVSTRIPIANVNIKAGMQMYPGLTANIPNSSENSTTKEYYSQALDVPACFVVSVGFSLGSKDAKGNNILRVF